jgi:hypothetical protein
VRIEKIKLQRSRMLNAAPAAHFLHCDPHFIFSICNFYFILCLAIYSLLFFIMHRLFTAFFAMLLYMSTFVGPGAFLFFLTPLNQNHSLQYSVFNSEPYHMAPTVAML